MLCVMPVHHQWDVVWECCAADMIASQEELVVIIDPKSVVFQQQPKWLAPAARRRMTGISLAVVLAMPMVSPAQTPQPDTQVVLVSLQTPDGSAALAAAIQKLNSGLYEEALTDLQAIKSDSLSESDRMLLADAIAKAEQASQMRRGARADFDKAEAALAEGQYVEAANLYKSVASNEYADEGTRSKAREQLAVAEAGLKSTETDLKAVYASAVADYKAGNYDSAKTKFSQLQQAGFKPAWFEKSPRQYLEAIEKEQAGPSPAEQARAAYLTGRDQYRKGDWIAARQNFNKAIELNYKPGWFEESPEKYLAIMDKKEKADAEKAAREAMLASATATEPPAPAQTESAPESSSASVASEPTATPGTPSESPAPTVSVADTEAEKLRQLAAVQELERANKAAQARKLVADAQAAEQAQNLSTAADLYTKALELDPENADALSGRNRTLTTAGLSPVQTDLATRQEQRILAERQAIVFNVDLALSKADAQIARGQFNEARQSITQAEVASRQNPGIFTNEELQNFQTRIATARTQLEQAVIASEEAARAAAQRTAEEEARQRQIEQERARQQAVSSLIADSRRLTEQGKYEEALKTVNQILSIDPNNDYAKGVRPILFDRASLNKQKVLRQKYTEQWIQTFDNLDEAKIPYSDILTYPADWPDLSARREQTVREERAITAADEAVAGLLEKSLPEIRFQDVAFADVIDFLRDTTQANIFVNWKALEAAGIDRNAPVSTRLRNVKFSKVLKTILDSVGGGATSQVSYTVDEGVITISTTEDLARNVETRTYDIRDLIIAIPDFTNAPDFSLTDNGNNTTGTGTTGSGGGFGGGGLFGSNSSNNNEEDEETPTRAELVEQITNLIRTTIGVGTWQEDGGQLGTLSELGGQLIVTQTPEVHRQISSLLEKLREQRSIQVMIEARFLTVQRNFLEDIGVDFDFFINNDGNPFEGLVPGTGPLPIGINGEQQTGFSPIAVQQNSANFTQAGGLQTGINGNLAGQFSTPNLSTTINAFLDDFQASLLIRATQGNQNVTQLTAPRVTLFNGQRAYVLVARQISYVSDLTPIVGTSAFGFDPTIDVIQSGVVLDVAATVSADRKYVTLTLRPQLSRIIGIQSFPVFGGTVDDGGTPGDPGDGGTTTGTGFIQQPEIEITEVRTSVSVPDGGTLLLGGTTLSGEVEREAGVPVLSKVPFLKRAFTNRGYARDESVLLIMVKPTIIIQREVEQENFPLLTSRAN
ncbi:MAG: hypothetical protein KatS3mg104_0503 [Phycisphaerae bacterium]|nr:MAG: hypothetical protein KatS3mg104_0503 [Phycisphaerae bacterium]